MTSFFQGFDHTKHTAPLLETIADEPHDKLIENMALSSEKKFSIHIMLFQV